MNFANADEKRRISGVYGGCLSGDPASGGFKDIFLVPLLFVVVFLFFLSIYIYMYILVVLFDGHDMLRNSVQLHCLFESYLPDICCKNTGKENNK